MKACITIAVAMYDNPRSVGSVAPMLPSEPEHPVRKTIPMLINMLNLVVFISISFLVS